MKKIIFVCVFIIVGFMSCPSYADDYTVDLRSDAWKQLRILHEIYLGETNYTTWETTMTWIAQDMNRWLSKRRKEDKQSSELSKQSSEPSKQSSEPSKQLTDENSALKKQLDCCKTCRNVAYSIIGIILVLFIAFILIKKCQAKKVPKTIEKVIANEINNR